MRFHTTCPVPDKCQLSHPAGRDSYATSKRSRGTSRVSRDARRPHMSSVLTDHVVPTGGTIALQVEVKGRSLASSGYFGFTISFHLVTFLDMI